MFVAMSWLSGGLFILFLSSLKQIDDLRSTWLSVSSRLSRIITSTHIIAISRESTRQIKISVEQQLPL